MIAKSSKGLVATMTLTKLLWILGLECDPLFDRHYTPHGQTELSCERHGWSEYIQSGPTSWKWQITGAGKQALETQKTRR